MRKLLKIAALIIAVMLGWGYRHASTHASIYISELPHKKPPVRVPLPHVVGKPYADFDFTIPRP